MDRSDEVSFSDYLQACARLEGYARSLRGVAPDEAVEHYLPLITRDFALVWSFLADNMTARHTSGYARSLAELQAVKDGARLGTLRATLGTLPASPQP